MWIQILIAVLAVVAVCFAFVLINGAPYLPTMRRQIAAALILAKLKPNNTIIELGCGDGRVLVAAAKLGYKVVGYELNPLLFIICWLRTWQWRRKKMVKVIFGDFWRYDWPKAEAVYVFLLPRLMGRLENKVKKQYPKGVKVISFAFKFPNLKPNNQKDGVFLYKI